MYHIHHIPLYFLFRETVSSRTLFLHQFSSLKPSNRHPIRNGVWDPSKMRDVHLHSWLSFGSVSSSSRPCWCNRMNSSGYRQIPLFSPNNLPDLRFSHLWSWIRPPRSWWLASFRSHHHCLSPRSPRCTRTPQRHFENLYLYSSSVDYCSDSSSSGGACGSRDSFRQRESSCYCSDECCY